ncbi:HTTM domain-containing protein [Apibacter muscae]|uniref:HTTM domain-containing protein n=1 Tax=Apibacter muscae TaxID=2509004 RepID=UPI002938F07C|nr:HTTM domain-containing protein [Apibacter muscae]
METINKKLLLQIDNSPLIIFRIFFGFLLSAETFGAILTGWVKENLMIPKVFFPFIGFEWLHPLPGFGMYIYFFTMGILGILVMIGYRYRLSLLLFTFLWTAQYLMQKTSYNNHYYFLLLVCIIMLLLPANAYASYDVKQKRTLKSYTMPQWCSYVMIFQVSILYFFATVAKLYPDWLNGTFTQILYANKSHLPIIGEWFKEKWFYIPIAYLGLMFDGLVVPFLLWKKTRTFALIASLIFHLSNSLILQVGIFPYFALSFIVFFYSPETIRKIFFKKHLKIEPQEYVKSIPYFTKYFFALFFTLQILLPLRHYLIKGNVFWTEEGHRLSWRMMLRQRSGSTYFKIVDKKTKEIISYNLNDLFTPKQISRINAYPDFIWQAARYIKDDLAKKGHEVEIFANSYVSVNNHSPKMFINKQVDLSQAHWYYFSHSPWILLVEDYRD